MLNRTARAFDGFIFHRPRKIICPVKNYEKWKQIKWNGNEIWFLLIPLILSSVCVCVSLLILQSFRFHLEITQWLCILSLGVYFIWFSLPYSRSAVCAQLNGKKWESKRRSSFLDIDHIEMSAFILLLTPFSFFEPYFYNWMSFLFIAAFLFAIVAAVVIGDIRFFLFTSILFFPPANETNRIVSVPENSPMIFFYSRMIRFQMASLPYILRDAFVQWHLNTCTYSKHKIYEMIYISWATNKRESGNKNSGKTERKS